MPVYTTWWNRPTLFCFLLVKLLQVRKFVVSEIRLSDLVRFSIHRRLRQSHDILTYHGKNQDRSGNSKSERRSEASSYRQGRKQKTLISSTWQINIYFPSVLILCRSRRFCMNSNVQANHMTAMRMPPHVGAIVMRGRLSLRIFHLSVSKYV